MQGRYCATRVYLWSVGKNSTRLHIVSVTSPKSPDLHSAFESDEIFRKNTFLENDVPCFASMTMRMHTELHVKTRGLLFCDHIKSSEHVNADTYLLQAITLSVRFLRYLAALVSFLAWPLNFLSVVICM